METKQSQINRQNNKPLKILGAFNVLIVVYATILVNFISDRFNELVATIALVPFVLILVASILYSLIKIRKLDKCDWVLFLFEVFIFGWIVLTIPMD